MHRRIWRPCAWRRAHPARPMACCAAYVLGHADETPTFNRVGKLGTRRSCHPSLRENVNKYPPTRKQKQSECVLEFATLLSSELDRHPPSGAEEDAQDTRASPLLEELRRRLGRTLRSGLLQFWKKRSVSITDYDPSYRVLYLGNIATPYAKGEGCADKPLGALWRNRAGGGAAMELTVCSSGMRASTRGFGTTEYWAYRVTYCDAPADHPGLFCWIYRHERPRMKQELRCHAALCLRPEQAAELAAALKERLSLALQEFRREKLTRQKARLSLANAVYDCPSMPHRKLLLSRGTINFRPPIEMSKIAPKLQPIDEDEYEDDQEEYEDDLLYLSSESSSLASSPEEEDLFPRFRRQARVSINSQGDTSCSSSSSSDEDVCEEDGSSVS